MGGPSRHRLAGWGFSLRASPRSEFSIRKDPAGQHQPGWGNQFTSLLDYSSYHLQNRDKTLKIQPPFSARHQGAHARIDNDFPDSARKGLLHLLHDFVGKRYVEGWPEVAHELQRIARYEREDYGGAYGDNQAKDAVAPILMALPWRRIFDFCERIYSRLAVDAGYYDRDGDLIVTLSREKVQEAIASEIQFLFVEEGLAFSFENGIVETHGRRHTNNLVSKAEVVLGDPKLQRARKHYEKALAYFRDAKKPDHQNAVKESVCAVEAASKVLFPDVKATTLDDVIKALSGSDEGQIPKAIAKTFQGLYGFRGSGDGIAHGAAEGGPVTNELAEYCLAIAASQIILLVDLAKAKEEEIPF